MNITPELAAALSKLQGGLPEIERDRVVKVNEDHPDPKKRYSYSYATLAHITEKIMPKLSANGLAYSAYPSTGQDGKMCLRYFLLHASGGFIGGEFPLPGEGGIQGLGGRITYAKRYCLLAVTGLAAEEDDESHLSADGGSAAPTTARRRSAASREDRAAESTERVRRQATTPAGGEPPPDDEPHARRNPDGPVTTGEQRKMFAQFRDLDLAAREQRDARLRVASALMGRELTSITDLTSGQAGELIEVLDRVIAAGDTLEARQDALTAAIDAARGDAAAEGTDQP